LIRLGREGRTVDRRPQAAKSLADSCVLGVASRPHHHRVRGRSRAPREILSGARDSDCSFPDAQRAALPRWVFPTLRRLGNRFQPMLTSLDPAFAPATITPGISVSFNTLRCPARRPGKRPGTVGAPARHQRARRRLVIRTRGLLGEPSDQHRQQTSAQQVAAAHHSERDPRDVQAVDPSRRCSVMWQHLRIGAARPPW
jgi:hypothetical protein